MKKSTPNVGIIAYKPSGETLRFYLPVFDSFPHNIDFVFTHQHFAIGAIHDKVILTLFCTDGEGNSYYEKVDISTACKECTPLRLCIIKTDKRCILYVYSSPSYKGEFTLSEFFTQMINLI